ncbi:MFS transporter [Photobacterium gaetbulicola]|uniref:Putative major facilitator transporter n=1 Tax=Photobacterium gaetbulicola Gung47 TaxID=658445 RepID=A0A0C5WHN2_9GAMM|nr:MFS transporter [Photobacterium gaetbulicola]AJR05682.1 putative major facilitator transporter [Photobacterium gaetbulicola Gung47]PSU14656.1 MFS transporter [Photobacterium gaetbulicola]
MYRLDISSRNTNLTRLYLIAFMAGFSLGIFPPLVSMLMDSKGVPTDLIGLTSSSYFITMAVITPVAGGYITRLGIKPVMLAGAMITAILSGCYAFFESLEIWILLRVISGIGMGLFLVAGQTSVNLLASNKNRTAVSTIYSILLGIGFGIGPVFAAYMYGFGEKMAFVVASIVIIISILIVNFGFKNLKPRCSEDAIKGKAGISSIIVPLHYIFAYGVLESVMISLIPLLVLSMGMTVKYTGYPFLVFILCSGLGMAFLGQLEKSLGKDSLLKLTTLIGCILLFAMSLIGYDSFGYEDKINFIVLLIFCGLIGLVLGPMFPLVLSMIGDKLDENKIASGSAWFTAMFSWGCGIGPILSSFLVERTGDKGWFFLVSAILFCSVLVNFHLQHLRTERKLVN